jgi:GNAT superfamily N-acetyltransferase
MDITIEFLNDHLESKNTIAKWHLDQWGHILPNFTFTQYKQFLTSHYKKGGIPSLFVAVDIGNVIGTAALEDYDMDTHQELSPWLASLYVDKKDRRRGVGEALIRRVIEEAKLLKKENLYLFTPNQEHYLARFGWKKLFQENYYGELETVMVLDISPHTPSR